MFALNCPHSRHGPMTLVKVSVSFSFLRFVEASAIWLLLVSSSVCDSTKQETLVYRPVYLFLNISPIEHGLQKRVGGWVDACLLTKRTSSLPLKPHRRKQINNDRTVHACLYLVIRDASTDRPPILYFRHRTLTLLNDFVILVFAYSPFLSLLFVDVVMNS